MAVLTIPAGVILLWAGANGAIPSGWVRETTMDGKYPKGTANATDPNTTGGSNTHTHSATAHGHNLVAHTHSVSTNHVNGSPSAQDTTGGARDNHAHASANIGNTSGGSLQNASVTWSSVNQEPPYHSLIFIKPSGSTAELADDIIALWNSATPPTGWEICDGDVGTPDLRNKYIKGAATGADAGATGGALTHGHTISHGHTANSHTHSGDAGAPDSGTRGGSGGLGAATSGHVHTITLNATTANVSDYTNTTAGNSDTVEPAYKKIAAIQNQTGDTDQPTYIIGFWLGSLASIPTGWFLCDGTEYDNFTPPDFRGKHIKIINTTGELGNTGGSNTHTHSAVSHTHSATGTHTHSGGTGSPSATMTIGTGSSGYANNTHTHDLTSVSSETATFSNTNIDCSTDNNEPTYRTVALIMFAGIPVESERAAKILGGVASERAAKIHGKDTASSTRAAKIKGWNGGWTKGSKPSQPTWDKTGKPTQPTWTKEPKLQDW